MRKKVTQRLVSGVLCLAMGITLISPVTSRAAETSEPTTQATTESASTETTTEVPVTTEVQVAPSEDVLFDHFYDTGILPATLQSKDFSSCELLVAADPIIFTKNTTVLSAYNGVYLLRFSSPEEAMYAYSYYYDKVELIDINAVIFQTSDDEHYEEVQADLSDLNQGDDALSEASTLPDVDLKKNTIALVDTGCEGTNVTQSVSVLGGESKDDNGHGTRMYDVIVEENPDAEILSIKALDKDGKAQICGVKMVYNTPPVLKKQRKINTLSSVFIKNGILITSTRAPLTTGRRRLRIKGRKLRDRECVVEQVATEHAAYVCVDAKMWHKEDNT